MLSDGSTEVPACQSCGSLTRERIFLKLATSTSNHGYYKAVRRAQFVLSRLLGNKLNLWTRVEYPMITSKVNIEKYEHMSIEQLHALVRDALKDYDDQCAQNVGTAIVVR